MCDRVENEVRGHPKGLIDAIDKGVIERPPLCDWNCWQYWRSVQGGRLRSKGDGQRLSPRYEIQLRRDVMEFCYGALWDEGVKLKKADLMKQHEAERLEGSGGRRGNEEERSTAGGSKQG